MCTASIYKYHQGDDPVEALPPPMGDRSPCNLPGCTTAYNQLNGKASITVATTEVDLR